MTLKGSLSIPISEPTINYTITDSDYFIAANATDGAITITLPTAEGIVGRIYIIKKADDTSYVVTVATNGSETIDGDPNDLELQVPYDSVQLVSDGANWLVISFSSAGEGLPLD